MRIFNTDIQSCQRSLPKWYIYQNLWNLMKKIEVIISTSNTDERAPGLIRKCMKYMYHKKYKYWSLTKPGKFQTYMVKKVTTFYCAELCAEMYSNRTSWQYFRQLTLPFTLNDFRCSYYDVYSSWISWIYRDKAYYFHLNFSKMIINKNKCGRNILIEVAQSMHQSISDSNHRSSRCWRHLSF